MKPPIATVNVSCFSHNTASSSNHLISGHGYLSFQESSCRPNHIPRIGNFLVDDESSSELISIIILFRTPVSSHSHLARFGGELQDDLPDYHVVNRVLAASTCMQELHPIIKISISPYAQFGTARAKPARQLLVYEDSKILSLLA